MLQGGETFTGDDWQAATDLTFELDLWGRLRRGTEAARAELLASEETRRVGLMTVVADVGRAHFDLLELDHELEIARHTLQTRQASLELSAGASSRGSPPSSTSIGRRPKWPWPPPPYPIWSAVLPRPKTV